MNRIRKMLLILGTVFFASCWQSASAEQDPLRISVKEAAPFTSAADPMLVTVIITNVTKEPVSYEMTAPFAEYRSFEVILEHNGHKLEETAFARRVHGRPNATDPTDSLAQHSILQAIQPGQSITTNVDLHRLFDIYEPGKYTLVVKSVHALQGRFEQLSGKMLPARVDFQIR